MCCSRNLGELNEEPKSAIEGLEGLALEYTWQELHQARCGAHKPTSPLRLLCQATDGFAASRQLGSGASGALPTHERFRQAVLNFEPCRYRLSCHVVRGHRSRCEGLLPADSSFPDLFSGTLYSFRCLMHHCVGDSKTKFVSCPDAGIRMLESRYATAAASPVQQGLQFQWALHFSPSKLERS